MRIDETNHITVIEKDLLSAMGDDDTDPITITEKDLLSVTPEGIRYAEDFISFAACAESYKEKHGGKGRCVGNRYALRFVFYTAPRKTHLFFRKQGFLKETFGTHVQQRKYHLQKQIQRFGYSTMDMT